MSGTTSSGSQASKPLNHRGKSKQERQSKAVWIGRIVFLLCLVVVAILLGYLAYLLVSTSENNLAQQQYEAIADRALDLAAEAAVRRRVAVKSMVQIASSAFPNATVWPNVAIPAFETIAKDILSTSGNFDLSFYPKVQPEALQPGEQSSFEDFAYNYFYNVRNPPFPDDTAVHNFGRGIWKSQDIVDGNTSWIRVHDTDGETDQWDTPHRVLFPEFQNSDQSYEGQLYLMYNVHAGKSKGEHLDEVLACSEQRNASQLIDMDCGVVTDIWSWGRTSYLIQPIYPGHDPYEVSVCVGRDRMCSDRQA